MGSSILGAVGFLHPSLAVTGLVCSLIPVIVHLMNRRRHKRVPWAAMSFLMAARRRSARRIWIEQLLLLFTRIALLILLGLALARPFVPSSSRLGLASSSVHHIILLDNSLSMQARSSDGVTRFERAKTYVEELIPGSDSTDAVSLVAMRFPANAVIEEPSSDLRYVWDQLNSIEVTQRATDVEGALRLASDILGSSTFPPANRIVYLVSDFPRSSWQSDSSQDQSAAVAGLRRLASSILNPKVDLRLVLVEPELWDNVGITRLQVADPSRDRQGVPTLVGVNVPVRLVCEVTNHGNSNASDRLLQVKIKSPHGHDGHIVRRQPIPTIEPGSSQTIVVTTSFSESGIHRVQAELIDNTNRADISQDKLLHDNVRFLSVDVRPDIPVLLVDGRPGLTLLQGQAGFLATALAPRIDSDGSRYPFDRRTSPSSARSDSLIHPKVITEPELPSEVLSDYAVVVLCNVRRLPKQVWGNLESYVAGGGGVAVFCGDQVQVDHYNRYGYAKGQGLLPGVLSRSRSTNGLVDNDGQSVADLGFILTQPPHPLVTEFDGRPESGLFLARVDRYLPIDLKTASADTVLQYSNLDSALIASSFGQGRVLLWTTTANMDWTNLPAKGDYVSIMLNAIAYLSPAPGGQRNLMVGETIREPLTAAQVSLPRRVLSVGAHVPKTQPELVPDGDSLVLSYGPIEGAGFIELDIGTQKRAFAVNVAPEESSLIGMTATQLESLLDFPFQAVTVELGESGAQPLGAVAARSTELASVAVYLVILLLLIEMVMAMRFGTQQAKGESHQSRPRPQRRKSAVMEAV